MDGAIELTILLAIPSDLDNFLISALSSSVSSIISSSPNLFRLLASTEV
jgi:hypothetical protein